ncbi:DNA primase [Patescibacteria group bacterium]|nr:DNA primase [Patescibacteria group bacterium]
MQPIDQIKSKLDIVDLISEYLQLKPAGQGSFKACCPFHQEKTPSFFVSKSKQIWHCFGCGEGGDQFAFVQKIEGVDFPQALQTLAEKAGVELPRYDKKEAGEKQKLIQMNELAAKFYHRVLLDSSIAESAREYIKKRNLDQVTVDEFKLGFAPDQWEALLNFLKKKEYKEEDINLAGLAVKKERGSGFYDRFRGRVMFPIQNIQGQVVGFTARSLKSDAKEAKYINTPQTNIYNKSDILYGLDKAKRAIKEKDLLIIVEGNMDVISSHRVGVKNVVASSGTALTQNQLNIIQRYTNNMAFSFDADSAGQVAAKRGIDLALEHGMNVSVILMAEDAKDPDEIINQDPALWQKAIDGRVNVMEYYFGIAKDKYDINTASGKKDMAKYLLVEVSKLSDMVEQSHWLQQLAGILNVKEDILREAIPRAGAKKQPFEPSTPIIAKKSSQEKAAEKMLAILINWPELGANIESGFHSEYLSAPSYQQIYKNIILFYNKVRKTEPESDKIELNFKELNMFMKNQDITSAEKDLFQTLAVAGERDWPRGEPDVVNKELLMTIEFLEKLFKQNKKQMLAEEMKKLEAGGDKEKIKDILKQFQKYE